MKTNKQTVRIRTKKTANGESIYLDCYTDGKREYKFLKLYLLPDNSREARARNKEIMRLAEIARSDWEKDIMNGKVGISTKKYDKLLLLDWAEICLNDDVLGDARKTILKVLIKYLNEFINGKKVYLADVDGEFCRHFAKYLKTAKGLYGNELSRNTQSSYFTTLSMVMKRAMQKGYISANPCEVENKPKMENVRREFLTKEEIRLLEGTEMPNEAVCRCFLFCCYSGLRISDIETLTWDEIDMSERLIKKRMEKTDEVVIVPLTANAERYLPQDGCNGRVFRSMLKSQSQRIAVIQKWAKMAGISKSISWHTSRHSFAANITINGGGISHLQNLLGHKSIKSTQVYADVTLDALRETANLLDW